MVRSRRHDDRFAVFGLVFFLAVKDERRLSLLDAEELVYLEMYFITYLFAGLQAHEHQLSVFPGENNLPEIVIAECLFFYGANISGHSYPPYGLCCDLIIY